VTNRKTREGMKYWNHEGKNTPNLSALNLYVTWMEGKFRQECEIVVLLLTKAKYICTNKLLMYNSISNILQNTSCCSYNTN
jgi:hypothetical protein